MTSIPIDSIIVENRQRIDHSDTDGIKASIATIGLIQPIILEETPNGYRLIAGGRRLTFLKELGHTHVYHGSSYDPQRPGYVLGRELTADQHHEIELEENIRRKAMTWQEHALAIANLHRLKVIRGIDSGNSWGQRQTGELLGVSAAKVNYTLAIAAALKSSPSHPFWKMEGPLDALRWMEQQKETKALAELARRQAETSAKSLSLDDLSSDEDEDEVDTDKERARNQYLSNPRNDPDLFESYYAERQALRAAAPKVYLTPRIHHGDCIDFMLANPACCDHIITDPPYAIDMDMLDQQNQKIANIDSIRATHDVDDNLDLLQRFFPAAWTALRDPGYLILWCDVTVWDFLYKEATASGFKVQRWPFVWVKTHSCKNSAAQYNFTKTTEVAMICRKGNATLIKPGPAGHVIAGHDEYKDTMDHPFVKPFEAWAPLVTAVSIQGQTILDPFAGEGSGPISFLRLNRNYLACEVDGAHYPKLMENIKKHYLGLDDRTQFV